MLIPAPHVSPPLLLSSKPITSKQKHFSSTVVFCNVFLCSEASGYNSMPKPTSVGKKDAVVSKSNSAKCFTSALVNACPLQVMEGSCYHPLWALKWAPPAPKAPALQKQTSQILPSFQQNERISLNEIELFTWTAMGSESQPTQRWIMFSPGVCALPFWGCVLWRKRLTMCHLVSPLSQSCAVSQTCNPWGISQPAWPFSCSPHLHHPILRGTRADMDEMGALNGGPWGWPGVVQGLCVLNFPTDLQDSFKLISPFSFTIWAK